MSSTNLLTDWRREEAERRLELISPLLYLPMDPAQKAARREELAESSGKSVRTIYRYEKSFRKTPYADETSIVSVVDAMYHGLLSE